MIPDAVPQSQRGTQTLICSERWGKSITAEVRGKGMNRLTVQAFTTPQFQSPLE